MRRAWLLALALSALVACEEEVQLGSLPPLPDAGPCDEDRDPGCDEPDEDEPDEDEPDEDGPNPNDSDWDPDHGGGPGGGDGGGDCPDGDESC